VSDQEERRREQVHRRKIRELDRARWGFVIGIVIWCVLAFGHDSQGQQVQKWVVQPSVKLDNEGGPHASLHTEAAIQEAGVVPG